MPVSTATTYNEINPPITYSHVKEDIPHERIYGSEEHNPRLTEATPAGTLAAEWFSKFNHALKAQNKEYFNSLFMPHTIWRDHLALSLDFRSYADVDQVWNLAQEGELRNFQLDPVADYHYPQGAGLVTYHPATDSKTAIEWVQCYYKFDTKWGKGDGVARLVAVGDSLKILTFGTVLEEFNVAPERIRQNRPEGVDHGQHVNRESWLERRAKEQVYTKERQPTVLIVGGGQGGLTTAARLKAYGVDSLIVESNKKIGDNWRLRYKFLVLHDPVWYDHLPYIPFPDNWPIYTPKDKLGDWFEFYAKSMELNYRCDSFVNAAEFDGEKWTVTVKDQATGENTIYTPKHLIMATGHSGEPRRPTFEGEENFKGKIVHSSKHTSGSDFTGGKALVVGGCNSAHDIAQDFYEQGVDVTMLQRSSTCIITSDNGTKNNIAGLYDETGPKVDTADLIFHSLPIFMTNLIMQQQYRKSCEEDYELLERLEKVGFKTNAGYNSTGLFGLYFRQGSGYYIDVGCSQLIADGKVKIKQGQGIKRFTETGVEFTDGTTLEGLDVVVLATGYTNMKDTAKRLFGTKVSDKLNPVWGLDKEGEFNTMWRASGHPNFWYMGGNLAMSRYYSKRLALQIVAQENGIQY